MVTFPRPELGIALLLTGSFAIGCGGDSPSSPSTPPSTGASSTSSGAPSGVTQPQGDQINAIIDRSVAAVFDAIAKAILDFFSQTVKGQGEVQINVAACSPTISENGDDVTIAGFCSVDCAVDGTATLSGTIHFNTASSALHGQGNIIYKECQDDTNGPIVDGTTFVGGTGHYPGTVSGTISGNVSVYTRGPGGGLVLVESNYGVLRNFTVPLR